ncbi:DUF4271 domain-containing protein [Sphingobacterium spiritivorum]|uniref:DUF4271 domain-containing protein n=1 Tax=Sphingobacterium spiritivorum TaxID=258 RepID=UPI003DA6B803
MSAKQFVILCLIIVMGLLLPHRSVANISIQTDSLYVDTVSSLQKMYPLIVPDADRGITIPQEIKDKVIVTNGNFIKWMKFADTLKKDRPDAIRSGDARENRPVWIISIIMILVFAVALVRLFFPLDFTVIIEAYFKDRLLQQVSKEDNMATSWSYIFLYIIFSFTLGLFLLMYDAYMSGNGYSLTLNNFLKISLIVGVLFILKILFIRFISFVFELDKLVREYIAVLYLVYFNSMLILMPTVLVLSLLPSAYFTFVISFSIILVFILFIYRYLRTAFHLLGNLRFSLFYLILYLCCLEIAPILILVRTLSK